MERLIGSRRFACSASISQPFYRNFLFESFVACVLMETVVFSYDCVFFMYCSFFHSSGKFQSLSAFLLQLTALLSCTGCGLLVASSCSSPDMEDCHPTTSPSLLSQFSFPFAGVWGRHQPNHWEKWLFLLQSIVIILAFENPNPIESLSHAKTEALMLSRNGPVRPRVLQDLLIYILQSVSCFQMHKKSNNK